MASPARGKPPPIDTERGSVLEPTTPTKFLTHKCPCKRQRSPDCNCPHDKGCSLRSIRPKPTTPSSIKSPFRRGIYTDAPEGTTASPLQRFSLSHTLGGGSTPPSPSTRPSVYDFGYDGSMSLYATLPSFIPTSAKRPDGISVVKDLPRDITRTFGGRVARKKKRPKDIKVPKTNDVSETVRCICDMKCNCRCWTLNSPIATGHSPMFDREVIR